jgi:zinc/manganese transport system substrate-binding protein
MRFILSLLFIVTLPLHFVAAQDGKVIQVTASFSILADVTKKIGGSRVNVQTIVPPDGDAHAYEAKPKDSVLLTRSQLLVMQGLGFDNYANKLATAADFKGTRIIASKGIKLLTNKNEHDDAHHGHGHDHGIDDPHTWHNPINMITTARNIATALAKIDPAGAAVYDANLASFTGEMRALDAFARNQFNKIPPTKRMIITSHDALGYLGNAYGIKIFPVLGFSTINDNSAQNMAALIDQARASGTKAIFLENISNPEISNTIAKELGVSPAGKLYTDALSAEGVATSYADMFRYNVMQIVAAMGK